MKSKIENNFSIDEIAQMCRDLKIPSFWENFLYQLNTPSTQNLSFRNRVGMMLSHERKVRFEKRKARLLKESGIRGKLSDYDRMNYDPSRNLDRGLLEELCTCRWITEDNPAHVIVTGASGTGKTWLIEVLGKCACQKGISVYYTRMSDLIDMLDIARKEQRVIAARKKINRYQLLLIDDFAMTPLSDQQADDFLSLIDGRQGVLATIFASQRDPSEWYDFFGEPFHADAVIDRILNHRYSIELRGRSLRERHSLNLKNLEDV